MKKKKNKKKNILGKIKETIAKRKKILLITLAISLIVFVIPKIFNKDKDLQTETIKKGSVSDELVLSGETKAVEDANLFFPASGKIIWMGVKEGDIVRKGQALAKLDTTKLNADYERALSDLRSAEASVEKVLDDIKEHSSDETFAQKEIRTTAEVAKDKAYEAVLKAKNDLKNATLIAPFPGIVSYIANPFAGIDVLSSQKQIEIVNPETIYFEVTADQTEVGKIYPEQKVNIFLDSFPDQSFEGEVESVSYTPKEGETSTVYRVKVKFVNLPFEKEKIRIGMTGDAKFILSLKEDVLWVPPKFVNLDIKGKYVLVDKRKIYIEIGLENEDQIEISGDIKEGQVVTD